MFCVKKIGRSPVDKNFVTTCFFQTHNIRYGREKSAKTIKKKTIIFYFIKLWAAANAVEFFTIRYLH